MKKFVSLGLCVLCFSPVFAANNKKNTMKMVSYFPVPYVAYDTVSANQSIDVGILNQCELVLRSGDSNLGGNACSLYLWGNKAGNDLNRGLMNVTSGKLMLNAGGFTDPLIKSEKVLAGSGGTAGYGWLDIARPSGKAATADALYLSSIVNKGNSLKVTGVANRGNDIAATVDSFKMFDQIRTDFPNDCNGEATWQAAELGGDMNANKTFTDVYLICNGAGGTPSPTPDPTPTPTECTAGQTKDMGACAKCGRMISTCSSGGAWGTAVCSNQGVCEPGQLDGWDGAGYVTRCSSACQWASECPSGCTEKTDVVDGRTRTCCSNSRPDSKVMMGTCVHPGCNWTIDSDGRVELGDNSFCKANLNCSASDLK